MVSDSTRLSDVFRAKATKCLAHKRFLIHGFKKQQQTQTRKKSANRRFPHSAARRQTTRRGRSSCTFTIHARPRSLTKVLGSPAVPLCDCTSLCVRERVRVRNPGRRERDGGGVGGGWTHGRDFQKQNQESRSETLDSSQKNNKTLDVSFLTPRVARRRRRVSRRSRRWVRRPRAAAVGWPISLCPWLQGTFTPEVFFFPSLLLIYIFFGIDCFQAATSAAHPPSSPAGGLFLFFCIFFLSQRFT